MKIILKKGLDILNFGASVVEAKEVLGKPTKKWIDDNGSINLAYYQNKLILTFEKEIDFKLGWIVVQNKSIYIENTDIWLMPKKEIVNLYSKILNEKPVEESSHSKDYIYFEESFLEFQFNFGLLLSVNSGVLFDEKDEPIFIK